MHLVVFWTILGLIVAQAGLALGYLLVISRYRRTLVSDEQAPATSVLLCLRGSDPFLPITLERLFTQTYPCYEVILVVDHPHDPAVPAARAAMETYPHVPAKLHVVKEVKTTCSLKCSGLIEAVREIAPATKIVAFLDADTVPHASWLRELVSPFADPKIGATTGNRWYMPSTLSMGVLTRYLWNAAAVVQMWFYGIAWGGTLALRREVIFDTDLTDHWAHAFGEDTVVPSVLRRFRWKLVFVPSLLMVNREHCEISGFFNWVSRQLLTTRLHHPAWPAVIGHGLITTLFPLSALVMAIVTAIRGEWGLFAWWMGAFALYEVTMISLLLPLEIFSRRIIAARGEATAWLTPWKSFKLLTAYPLTQLLYFAAVLNAAGMRSTVWRGITYQILRGKRLLMTAYQPYQPRSSESETSI